MSGQITLLNASTVDELKAALETLSSDADPFFMVQREYLIALVSEQKISAVYPFREFTDVGGLISYGTNIANAYRQSGALKEFTGVEAALGLTIPASIVARCASPDAWGRPRGPRFTISLKRSTTNLQLSTRTPADYPIFWH